MCLKILDFTCSHRPSWSAFKPAQGSEHEGWEQQIGRVPRPSSNPAGLPTAGVSMVSLTTRILSTNHSSKHALNPNKHSNWLQRPASMELKADGGGEVTAVSDIGIIGSWLRAKLQAGKA